MRSLSLALILVTAACSTDRCKQGTVFLAYTLINGAEAADAIDVTLAVGGGAAQTMSVARKTHGATGSIEVDFRSYPSGQSLAFTLTARASGAILASASQTTTASKGCTALAFTLDAGQGDLGTADLAGFDASSGDMVTPVVAMPRLVAPLSTSTVTQQKPTLHWVLGPGPGTPVVDLCKDRSCATLLSVPTQVAGDNLSAVPAASLPAGWVFWRVRVVVGTATATSATWQFWVGKTSASNAVDSSSGTILDVNGDGYPDFLIGAGNAGASSQGAAHLYLGNSTATGFQRIDLISPDGTGANFGISVANAGDVNGDGYADFLVGGYGANMTAGAAHLYFGEAVPSGSDWNGTAPSKRIDLSSPDSGSAEFGWSVASAGDVNRDGYADFLVGDHNASAAHLFLGGNGTALQRIDLANPDTTGLGTFGYSVSAAGDINGDGYADFLIGSSGAGAVGAAYLYLGEATASLGDWNGASAPKRLDLASPATMAQFGISTSSAGDVNGDGYSDFVVGANRASTNSGAAYLYLGGPSPSTSDWNGASPTKRTDLLGPDGTNAYFGGPVASAGDVNGDGYADFFVGAPFGSSNSGVAHLYLGNASGTGLQRVDLTDPDGVGASFGNSAAGVGDVNGDGYIDFLVGAYGASTGTGAAHLYLGEATPIATDWNGSTPSKRIDISNPDGAGAGFGSAVASAGVRERALLTRRQHRSAQVPPEPVVQSKSIRAAVRSRGLPAALQPNWGPSSRTISTARQSRGVRVVLNSSH